MRTFIFLCFLYSLALHGSVLREEFLSPEIDNFDCHGSSLVETAPGKLCAVWKGGPGKGRCNSDISRDIGIWSSRFEEGEWSEPQRIVDAPDSVCWTPVLVYLPSGEVLLFYRLGPDPRRVVGLMKRSQDGGKSWSVEELLPAGIFGPVRSKPIVKSDGTLICGSSIECGSAADRWKATACWIDISPDGGRSWKKYGPLEIPGKRFGALEPALFYDGTGRLKMVCRDRSHKVNERGYIWTAVSEDEGKSWSPLEKTSLPNPDSAVETVDLGAGVILLVYNHSFDSRTPLNIALSRDGGGTWHPVLELEGEFPAAILTADGLVHITYAFYPAGSTQRRIKHAVIDPSGWE